MFTIKRKVASNYNNVTTDIVKAVALVYAYKNGKDQGKKRKCLHNLSTTDGSADRTSKSKILWIPAGLGRSHGIPAVNLYNFVHFIIAFTINGYDTTTPNIWNTSLSITVCLCCSSYRMEGQDCFTASKLRGHRASVTCLQADADQQNLLSGSDDKTVRLWDLRINRSTKCMLGCFGSPIEAVKFASSNIVYAACANAVYSFDLRYDGVLTKVPLAELSMGEGPDEISNLAINNKGDMLAAAMDSGVINLVPIRGNGTFCENSGSTRYKRLTRVHNNIISTVSFKKNNPRELLSGGFDYTGCLWEVDRGRPKISTNFQSMPTPLVEGADPDEERNPLQIINPPFVMSMNYIMDGRCVVAALGDGTVSIFLVVLMIFTLANCNPSGIRCVF